MAQNPGDLLHTPPLSELEVINRATDIKRQISITPQVTWFRLCIGITVSKQIMSCDIDGLVQDRSDSNVLAMELLQSCTKPSIHDMMI